MEIREDRTEIKSNQVGMYSTYTNDALVALKPTLHSNPTWHQATSPDLSPPRRRLVVYWTEQEPHTSRLSRGVCDLVELLQ